MYQPGGQPTGAARAAAAGRGGRPVTPAPGHAQARPLHRDAGTVSAVDLDLDLDFSLGDEPVAHAGAASAATPAGRRARRRADGFAASPAPAPRNRSQLDAPDLTLADNSLNMDFDTPAAGIGSGRPAPRRPRLRPTAA